MCVQFLTAANVQRFDINRRTKAVHRDECVGVSIPHVRCGVRTRNEENGDAAFNLSDKE